MAWRRGQSLYPKLDILVKPRTPSNKKGKEITGLWVLPSDLSHVKCLGEETLSTQYFKHNTYNLHCSSFFWFNQVYMKDPIR